MWSAFIFMTAFDLQHHPTEVRISSHLGTRTSQKVRGKVGKAFENNRKVLAVGLLVHSLNIHSLLTTVHEIRQELGKQL